MKITIVANPFLELPPNAIGAMEILWHDLAKEFFYKGHDIKIYGKGCSKLTRGWVVYLKGFNQSSNVFLNIIKIILFNLNVLWRMPKTDILVVNNILGPFVPLCFFWKYKKLVYNAARTPKSFYRLFKAVDGVCCPSTPIERIARGFLPKKNVVTIPNPIDTTCFYEMDIPKGDDIVRIGYHGRVHPEKGVHILATAVKNLLPQYPNLRLRVIGTLDVGKGGGGDAYRDVLENILPNQIEWIKPIANRIELAKRLAECDIYSYPSVAEVGETFGVAPLEAMGVAKPVIVSNLDCFKDFVKNGENGLIFDHRVSEPINELKEMVQVLLDRPDLAKMIAKKATITAQEYSNQHVASAYIRWFESLLEN